MSSSIWDWTYGFAFFSLGVFFEHLRASGERTLSEKSSSKPVEAAKSSEVFHTVEYVELVDEEEMEARPTPQSRLRRSTSIIVSESEAAIRSVNVRVYQEHQKTGNETPRKNTNSQIRRITQRNNPPETNR